MDENNNSWPGVWSYSPSQNKRKRKTRQSMSEQNGKRQSQLQPLHVLAKGSPFGLVLFSFANSKRCGCHPSIYLYNTDMGILGLNRISTIFPSVCFLTFCAEGVFVVLKWRVPIPPPSIPFGFSSFKIPFPFFFFFFDNSDAFFLTGFRVYWRYPKRNLSLFFFLSSRNTRFCHVLATHSSLSHYVFKTSLLMQTNPRT